MQNADRVALHGRFSTIVTVGGNPQTTRAAHSRIEACQSMRRLVSDDYTVREYVGHLSDFLGFYEPFFEEALARAAAGSLQTSRSALLADDLMRLGLNIDQIRALPRCEGFPSIAGRGTLGALFVYDGSALGGQIIARRLRRLPGASQREIPALQGTICETALAVFGALGGWLERDCEDTTGTSM